LDQEEATGVAKTLRQEHTEHTRLALLAAATRLFADRGYAQTSIDDVVALARVTRGALYHHFSSKQDIFRAVCDAEDHKVVDRVREAATAAQGLPQERMLVALDTFFTESRDPTYRAIVLREAHEAQVREEGRRYTPAMADLIGGMVRELEQAGVIKTDDPDMLTRMLCATLCEAATVAADEQTKEYATSVVCRMLFTPDAA
jgi:AcrR family transcriptional regulator